MIKIFKWFQIQCVLIRLYSFYVIIVKDFLTDKFIAYLNIQTHQQ